MLKVSNQSDPLIKTLKYAVLDDQSTDVSVTDPLLHKLKVSGQEVNLQVSTIVGTNTTRRVSGLQILNIDVKHSPVKVPYAYAQEHIPASHYDITTPDIAKPWEHLRVKADKIHHQPDVEIGKLIARNVPTAFQAINVINGGADKPWAEEYKLGWTFIGPVCLDQSNPRECDFTASVNRLTVQREDMPVYDCQGVSTSQAFNAIQKNGPVALLVSTLRSKDFTSPQQIREMMELNYSEFHHSRKVRGTNRFNRLKINASVTSSVQEFTRIKKETGRHHYPSKRMKSTFQTTGSIALDDSSR